MGRGGKDSSLLEEPGCRRELPRLRQADPRRSTRPLQGGQTPLGVAEGPHVRHHSDSCARNPFSDRPGLAAAGSEELSYRAETRGLETASSSEKRLRELSVFGQGKGRYRHRLQSSEGLPHLEGNRNDPLAPSSAQGQDQDPGLNWEGADHSWTGGRVSSRPWNSQPPAGQGRAGLPPSQGGSQAETGQPPHPGQQSPALSRGAGLDDL